MTPLLLAVALFQPSAPDLCTMLSTDELTAVLGAAPSGPGKMLLPGTFTWAVPGVSFTVADTDAGDPVTAAQMVDAARTRARAPEVVKDEPSLGAHAVSVIGGCSESVDLYVASGPRLWRFGVETGDKRIQGETVLDNVRALARKAITSSH